MDDPSLSSLVAPLGDTVAAPLVPVVDAAVLDAARRAMSANSWRALRADLKVFAAWAKSEGRVTLPALPETVAAFLRAQGESGKKAATLARYASSIARAHTLADLPDPTRSELVRLELKAQRRELGVRQKQARGLRFRGEVADPLASVGPMGVCVEAMLAAAPGTTQGLRDRALLSLAFDTGLRRSEIVAARWLHVEKGNAGAGRLFVPRSKADQEGAGAYAYLSARTMAALAAWRDASGSEGPVFRRLHRARDKAGIDVWTVGAGLSAQSVTLVYRAMLEQARAADLLGDIAQADFDHWRQSLTAHSTRVGLTQDLFAAGQDLAGIMQALRWKSPQQPARYAQALAVEANAAAKVVGKL
ncbi:tyrosine-type recombinase/integrase [Novosphingobium sp. KCTC 2891]|uniref:tyrosine-type recombinase/integrase n=1 Tax=Novosphingobium sp. KCTC 2891 TaxID=2989730 RepID=UPI002221B788|nr:tyrosine-type recombinase/integrase [Novosphingobium sp. KCTC 2891]MCW1385081.1 tyrosine-type recombinase/integrase [Novosphingobium sp. KCTC 2891]